MRHAPAIETQATGITSIIYDLIVKNVTTFLQLIFTHLTYCGPRYFSRCGDSLWAGPAGDRILVEARFPAPVQTVPRVHPVTYLMGIGSLPGSSGRSEGFTTHPI